MLWKHLACKILKCSQISICSICASKCCVIKKLKNVVIVDENELGPILDLIQSICFYPGNSQPELEWLLHNTKNSTLTIWGQDQLNEHQVQQLKSLIASLNSKVHLDMSPQLKNRILQTWNKSFLYPPVLWPLTTLSLLKCCSNSCGQKLESRLLCEYFLKSDIYDLYGVHFVGGINSSKYLKHYHADEKKNCILTDHLGNLQTHWSKRRF